MTQEMKEPSSRKIIFVCSPLTATSQIGIELNMSLARKICRLIAIEHRNTPIAPHVYFPQFLDENSTDERNLGISLGSDLLSSCDEVWVFKLKGNESEGMKKEITIAKEKNIPILYKNYSIAEDIITDQ